jgi:hypothetical protein
MAGVVQHVVHPVDGNTRLHGDIDVLESRLQLGFVGGERCQRRQVPPCRPTGDGDESRIDSQLRGVGPHPGDDAFDVDEVIREGGLRAEAMRGGEHLPSRAGEAMYQWPGLGLPPSPPPSPAVHVDECRARS